VAVEGSAESLPSNPVNVNVPDTFPPSIPTNVTALASPDGIELSWERSPESDVAGYYVYRATGVSSFTRVDGLSSLPVFSDKNVEHGKKYAYRVSAVDTSGNESERSAAAEVEAP
jgi:fibronectin type 3 domain-containing protein